MVPSGELDAAYQLQSGRLRDGHTRIKSVERVVIGDGQRFEAGVERRLNEFFRTGGAVGEVSMRVKVDQKLRLRAT